ncbi:MAG TPA: DnaA/Hda family protein [Phycisphaerales bacterium]|nr:DnaA/Hda family protein [Phycisphaerales bacterium]
MSALRNHTVAQDAQTRVETRQISSQEIAEHLQRRLGRRFHKWFETAEFDINQERLSVVLRNRFAASWVTERFENDLRCVADDIMGPGCCVVIHTQVDDRDSAGKSRAKEQHSAKASDLRPPIRLHGSNRSAQRQAEQYSLDRFVVGDSNKVAYLSALQLVDEPKSSISPLFIHSECGLGKTHLLQGLCRRYVERTQRPGAVRYLTAEQFTNDFVTAIRNNSLDSFRHRMRRVELLAIDDVHFLASKSKTQSEFLHTLDAIDLTGARVVLASDEHPRQIQRLNQALVSRFVAGMVVRIDRPERALRVQIIRHLANERGLSINDAVVEAVADQCISSIREIQGALTKLSAIQMATGGSAGALPGSTSAKQDEIGCVTAGRLFGDESLTPGRPVPIESIVRHVCAKLCVQADELSSSARHPRIVLARRLNAYLCRTLTTRSFPEIARALGVTSHSSIHNADSTLRDMLKQDVCVELPGSQTRVRLQDVVDQLRHEVLRSLSEIRKS